MTKVIVQHKGGAGSGHHGHAGRPGKHGGSLPGDGGGWETSGNDFYHKIIGDKRVTIIYHSGKNRHFVDYQVRKVRESDGHEWWEDVKHSTIRDFENAKKKGDKYFEDTKPKIKPEDTDEFWQFDLNAENEGFEPDIIDLREGIETNWVDKYEDVPDSEMGKGYFISSEDKLVAITDEFGPLSNDHPGYMAASADREKFGLSARQARDMMAGYISDDMDAVLTGWKKIYDYGTIRVREFGKEIIIQSKSVDRSTLRRLQRLYDNDKLGMTVNQNIVWENYYMSDTVRFTYEDFLDANYVDTNKGILKETSKSTKVIIKFKGGAGSGHHGHAGLKGEHGGSLPSKLHGLPHKFGTGDKSKIGEHPTSDVTSESRKAKSKLNKANTKDWGKIGGWAKHHPKAVRNAKIMLAAVAKVGVDKIDDETAADFKRGIITHTEALKRIKS